MVLILGFKRNNSVELLTLITVFFYLQNFKIYLITRNASKRIECSDQDVIFFYR